LRGRDGGSFQVDIAIGRVGRSQFRNVFRYLYQSGKKCLTVGVHQLPRSSRTIPVVDLFAGPGGLGEGFAAFRDSYDQRVFQTALSIEKERWAHQTLLHRSAFRNLKRSQDRLEFLELLSDKTPERALDLQRRFRSALDASREVAWRAELGVDNRTESDPECDHPSRDQVIERISGRLDCRSKSWVLLGGPPCQAYSLVGRSRNIGKLDYKPENDHRHFLYREYLAIIAELWPSVFVMENVKGILSAKFMGN
jgi:DNA (cytosine-5)-methyltransferase 1